MEQINIKVGDIVIIVSEDNTNERYFEVLDLHPDEIIGKEWKKETEDHVNLTDIVGHIPASQVKTCYNCGDIIYSDEYCSNCYNKIPNYIGGLDEY